MKTIRILSLIFLFFSSFLVLSNEAHDYVEIIHERIVDIIIEGQAHYEKNPDYFVTNIGKALVPLVDFDRISKNVMGRYYKGATELQREKFSFSFKNSLLNTYSKTLAEFKDERIIVLPPIEPSKRPDRDKVYFKIVTSNKVYSGVYSMYKDKEGDWKVINIIINGINLGLTFRKIFYQSMKDTLNNYDEVINTWETSI